jgi:hypothetical protein
MYPCWAVLDFYEEPLVPVLQKTSEWFWFHKKMEPWPQFLKKIQFQFWIWKSVPVLVWFQVTQSGISG